MQKVLNNAVSLLVVMAALTGCGSAAEWYRDGLETRRAIPLTNDREALRTVDLVQVLDPLGLGQQRTPTSTSTNDPSVSNSANLEAAYLGFMSPQYPALLCSDPDGTPLPSTFSAEDAAVLCRGLNPMPLAPPKPVAVALITETKTTKTINHITKFDNGSNITEPVSREETSNRETKPLVEKKVPFLILFQTTRRNQIQDRLLQASNDSCAEFEQRLLSASSDAGFYSNVFSLGFTTAGAIFSGSAQVLSALGAGSIGTGTALQKSYYQDKAISVIAKGMDTRRQSVISAINLKRPSTIEDYTVQAAVSDAILYHNDCSLLVGLQEAEQTLEQKNADIKKTNEQEETKDPNTSSPAGGTKAGGNAGNPPAGKAILPAAGMEQLEMPQSRAPLGQ